MEELISVVVPAYNVELYISECIKSVQLQTYENWELIIVNDGSKDNTHSIAKDFAARDARILVHTQDNQGVSVARNAGMQLAKGKYIIFLDGDDYWKPDCLSELLIAIQTSGADFSYCGYNHAYGSFARNYRYQYADGDVLLKALQGKIRFQLGAVLINRAFLLNSAVVFSEGCPIGEDLEFMLKLAAIASVKSVQKNLLMYRVRASSAINSSWNCQKRIHSIYAYIRAAEYIEDKRSNHVDWIQIKKATDNGVAFKVYKFLWRTIKNQGYEAASKLLHDKKIIYYLTLLDKEDLSLLNRAKLSIVLSQKMYLWKLARSC